MKNIDFLLNKLRYVTDTKTDKELCKTLNINYSTLDTWKNNDNIPKKRLLEFSQKLNIPLNDLLDISKIVSKPVFTKNEIKINNTLLEQAKEKASQYGLSINAYLEFLIVQDLK
ncbi:helix-turn-helix domain-containing protein [Aliarcobacter cryaerophilus]|uniref:Helix-turn-helix domain-containing protein n=1 Tax=Aliarcobacter cryaerophilus TaxID=28198 RepID=A0AA46N661_9BACT|nr:helix-turn-helix domain-containing protein [Aliarcobacter cryaerophilus]UYF42555.1 helix-turn-helix domain-containing protein [Aliarcobacter cryaerophilus]